jgi:hypothetical protein
MQPAHPDPAPAHAPLPANPQLWWQTAPASLRATLWMLLADLPPELPLLLLAVADVTASELDDEAAALFCGGPGAAVVELRPPEARQREVLFEVRLGFRV